MKASLRISAAVMAAIAAGGAGAAECRATAEGPVAVVELYTSEGCNSCPPADRWLSAVAQARGLPVAVVPLALHVPYWDYIGWRDRFAMPRFEARQRLAVQQGRSPTVYTPQVMLNGRDFRAWGSTAFSRELARLAAEPGRASITMAGHPGQPEVEISGRGPAGARVVLARYEDGLASQVNAGENAGVRLEHDRVVRDWVELGTITADGSFRYRHAMRAHAGGTASHGGLVSLVEDPASGEILQAAELPHCGGG